VSFTAVTLFVASQRMFISSSTQSGNFWIHRHMPCLVLRNFHAKEDDSGSTVQKSFRH